MEFVSPNEIKRDRDWDQNYNQKNVVENKIFQYADIKGHLDKTIKNLKK